MTGASTAESGSLRRVWRQIRPLLRVVRPYRGYLVATATAGIVSQALLVAAGAVGALMVGLAATGSADGIASLLVALVVLVVVQAGVHFVETYLSHVGAFKALADIRRQLYDRIERLAPAWTVHRRTGDLASVAMGDVELLELFFAHTLAPLAAAIAVPVLAVAAVALIDPVTAIVLLPFLLLVATVPTWLRRHGEIQGGVERQVTGDVAASLVDAVQGARETLAYDAADWHAEALSAQGRRLKTAQVAHGSRVGMERAAIDVLVTAGVLAVTLVAGVRAAGGELDLAVLPVAVVVAAAAFVPVTTLTNAVVEMGRIGAAAERVQEILEADPPVVDRPHAASRPATHTATVQFDSVRFRYAANLPEVLAGVSFTVEQGETVALVGESGAGKTTCSSLVLRLWDVTGGAVRIGGTDVRDLTQEALRQLVATVPQDVHLFHESLRDNLVLGRPDADPAAVEAVARAALVDEFAAALPEGYDTVLGERGSRLSGGQRQRVAVARALVRDSPVMILDEAVSALDAESEVLLQEAMASAARGRTTLVIAHRLSTIRAADRIVVLARGRVVETGTFDDLIQTGGHFSELVARGLGTVSDDRRGDSPQ